VYIRKYLYRLKSLHNEQNHEMSRLKSENLDLIAESESFQASTERMLILTQQLTDKNMFLQSENADLGSKVWICLNLKEKGALFGVKF